MKANLRLSVALPLVCFVLGVLGAVLGNTMLIKRESPTQARYAAFSGEPYAIAEARAGTPAKPFSNTTSPFVAAVRKVGPATVNIDTVVMRRQSAFGFGDPFGDLFGGMEPFTRLVPSRGQGSGLIVDAKNGYVLTNDHVVRDVVPNDGKIRVGLSNKQTFDAKVLGSDPTYDIAVLKINGGNLPAVKLSPKEDLEIGEWVIAIGNPYGFRNTVTVGVLSATDRSLAADQNSTPLEGLLQTDAAINPGNSGGPLCDIDGNVIGINTAIIGGASGLGFAISASSIQSAVDEIIKFGRVRHGWTGATFWDITDRLATRLDLKSTDGALVVEIYRDSPADAAGIKPGDVVLEADGRKIQNAADMQSVLRDKRSGDSLKLRVSRKGKSIDITLKLADTPEQLRGNEQ